ncbi:MAG: hypothetical protein WCP09_00455 [Candidatus Taylorbacteria bacterium]
MNKTSLINRIVTVTGLALGGFALSVLAATTWTAPSTPPPGNNVDAPINVGASTQKKAGALGIGSGTMPGGTTIFDVFGTAVINALQTASINVQGTPGSLTVSGPTTLNGPVRLTSGASANVGKYLQMADASGNVTWGSPTSGTPGAAPTVTVTAEATYTVAPKKFKCPPGQVMTGIAYLTTTPGNVTAVCDELSAVVSY